MGDIPELKAAQAAVRNRQSLNDSIEQAFQDGQSAFLAGFPQSACRLRTASKRNAWERGWLDAERMGIEQEAVKNLSTSDKAEILSALGKVKDLLK